jgi:hypothetical protein
VNTAMKFWHRWDLVLKSVKRFCRRTLLATRSLSSAHAGFVEAFLNTKNHSTGSE